MARRDENTCRLPFSPTEALEMAESLRPFFKEEAKEAIEMGRKKGGGDRRSEQAKRSGGKSTKAKRDNSKRSDERAAKATGYSAKTLKRVAEIKKAAEELRRVACLNAAVDNAHL